MFEHQFKIIFVPKRTQEAIIKKINLDLKKSL